MKAAFLDRDGVINIDKNHVYKIEDFEFIENIFPVCRKLLSLNYELFVVTNQAGIAKQLYTMNEFNKLTSWMLQIFSENNINIRQVYYCPHHPDFTGQCLCRKPKPGMLLRAASDHDIDLKKSILIGDKMSDIEAGIASKLKINYLLTRIHKNKKIKNLIQIQDLTEIFKFL